MSGWLAGKRARIEGDSPAIATAVEAAGATLVSAGDHDIWIHVAPPSASRRAHEIGHAEWRATLDAGLDRRFPGAKDFADRCRARRQGGAILFVGDRNGGLEGKSVSVSGSPGGRR